MAGEETAAVRQAHAHRFGASEKVRVFRAPGRVNLIGEHTDYNLGFVLPIAMDKACYAAAAPATESVFRVYSENMRELVEWRLEEVTALQPRRHWSDYVVGVAQQIARLGMPVPPLDIAVYSTVPTGAGLSSSAAIEVASALAILNGRTIDRTELARLAQRAEREFVGMPCGIMDQYVSVFGEAGKAIRIDCRSVTHDTAQLPAGVTILAVNSMVKHELGASEYPVRVRECQQAVEAIRQPYPAVESLRDVTSEILDLVADSMPELIFRRARHVVTEDERVGKFVNASEQGDLHEMGRLFLASHRSLQHDYEVSAEELDFLVDAASDFSGVYGARMTGGGFGGCIVALVAPNRVELFRQYIKAAYERQFGITPEIYECVPSEGASEAAD